MGSPLAYFLTWTCYGTWLTGDARGSVSGDANAFQTPYLAPDARVMTAVRRELSQQPLILDAVMRSVVDQAVRDHCSFREWTIHALNVRSNHVHIVLSEWIEPEQAMTQLKSWSTRRLREANLIDADRRVWTKHGSTRYLWDPKAIHDASVYVRDGQD